jgi:protoporphyrinogen oxidase
VDWPGAFRSRLGAWRYRAALVLLLELRTPFSGTYWLNVAECDVPFIGLIEHTNFVPAERYPAKYLYVSSYLALDDARLRMSTDELLRHYLPGLRRISPRFDERENQRVWSFREEAAQPIPEIGNRHRLLPYDSPIDGVFIANTTQIYPEDRGTNCSVRLGREVAAKIAARRG